MKPRVRETTWVSYRMAVDRITRQIGAVQLQSLTPLQVEGLYATLLERLLMVLVLLATTGMRAVRCSDCDGRTSTSMGGHCRSFRR